MKEEAKKGYLYTDLPVPEPVKDEVLIKVEKVAICGSDINLFLWNEFAKVIATIPFTPGHEATGVVVKAGPEATIEVGTKVAVENHFYCGDCYTCEVGNFMSFFNISYFDIRKTSNSVNRKEEATYVPKWTSMDMAVAQSMEAALSFQL